jgi:peptide/nickel transport system ATP-binding protein
MIFQNSASSFDSRDTIGDALCEAIRNFEKLHSREASERAEQMLAQVGLDRSYLWRYPRELSGGQRQRANIARALILHPRFVVCDEPVSSLDFSIRKQTLDLLNELKAQFGLTYLFISHDLSTVRYVCDTVAVMYLGRIVERMEGTEGISERICHPYSRALFDSVPVCDPNMRKTRRAGLHGEATVRDIPSMGCRFHTRCPCADNICEREEPKPVKIADGHIVACHRIG